MTTSVRPSAISNKSAVTSIILISLALMAFLFWLIYFKSRAEISNFDVSYLQGVNALCNGLSAFCVLSGIIAIKNKKISLHKRLMKSAFFFSAIFLVSYITYYALQGESHFQGEGIIRPIYFFILISHIVLSVLILPLILSTFYFGLSEKLTIHRKIAKFTYPLWFYVSVSGVLIYVLLKAYS